MQLKQWTAQMREKIREIRYLNAIIGTVVGVMLVLWAVAALIFYEKDIGTDQAAQEVQQLSENIRKFYQNRPDFWGLNTTASIEKQIAPRAMLRGNSLTNSFGTPVKVGNGREGTMLMPGARNFDISFQNLNNQQCRELASFRFEQKFWLGVIEVQIFNGERSTHFDWNNSENMLPIKIEQAKQSCGSDNTIVWHFG